MLSAKNAGLAVKILLLGLVAAVSFFWLTAWIPDSNFVEQSVAHVEESNNTVMKLSAATLSTSVAISALPDDFATPLAESLSDMNIYFVAILVVLFLEKILILYGVKMAFAIIIPLACAVGVLALVTKKNFLKSFAIRVCVLGLAVALVVPCSTHVTEIVAADLGAYVDSTIEETNDGADKLNEAMEGGAEDQTVFEKLSDLFQTAVSGVSDLMLHFQNTIRKCMNSIAILILTNCLMPLMTFFILKWILKELFQIALPLPPLTGRRDTAEATVTEIVAAGE